MKHQLEQLYESFCHNYSSHTGKPVPASHAGSIFWDTLSVTCARWNVPPEYYFHVQFEHFADLDRLPTPQQLLTTGAETRVRHALPVPENFIILSKKSNPLEEVGVAAVTCIKDAPPTAGQLEVLRRLAPQVNKTLNESVLTRSSAAKLINEWKQYRWTKKRKKQKRKSKASGSSKDTKRSKADTGSARTGTH